MFLHAWNGIKDKAAPLAEAPPPVLALKITGTDKETDTMEYKQILEFSKMTRELIARCTEMMPQDKLNWKFSEHSKTFAEIVMHILNSRNTFVSMISGQPNEAKPYTVDMFPTPQALANELREQGKRAFEVLSAVPASRLSEVVKSPFGMEMPAGNWATVMLMHESDHKGNLVIVAKICGLNPPDIGELRKQMAASTN